MYIQPMLHTLYSSWQYASESHGCNPPLIQKKKTRKSGKKKKKKRAEIRRKKENISSVKDDVKMLKDLVKERLMAAADEIFELFERTIASYEEELCRTRAEKERHRRQLEAVCKTPSVLRIEDVQKVICRQEERPTPLCSTLKQEDPHNPDVKEEEEELWVTQEGECLLEQEETALTELAGISVKTEDHEGPSSSSSPQHMTTESDEDHCGGSQADNLLPPLSDSDDTASHSHEAEDRDDTQGPLNSVADCEGDSRTQTDKKHSECSKKKAGKKCLTCPVCWENISNKSDLTRHMRSHTGEQPFSCSVCHQRFSHKSNIRTHMRTHTGEKPFGCSVCGRRFSQKSNMMIHMRTHTGEKPFSCSVCGRRFSEKSSIVSHMRTHTGEKPCICSICGRRFSEKTNMISHMRTHTGEKPYVCLVCDKRFTNKVTMVKHMNIHERDKPVDC
ncbi:zinc finger protein 771-like isoform X2 [Dunckerocampus dactyliophorus]|uniref:zinc finger protein 771-like isoform X2 n=1 Tax=Dunckerocampus dactyliophorus TaxID=161453 RepID=UPI00240504E8|nr:zinc finger protein 771-like isoform X2 [Dunckerocampus dactyliophorus]